MFVPKLHSALLNQCSCLTTLPSQPLAPELGGNHATLFHWQRAHRVLECGERRNLGLSSSMLCRTGLRASPQFSLFLPTHCDFCPRHVVPWKNSIFRSETIILRGQVHASQLCNWTCRMSPKHSECPQGGTTDYCESGSRLCVGVLVGLFLFCFLLYFLVSLDCVVQGVFSPVMFLPQLPKYWMTNTCHCAPHSANFSHS